MKAIHFINMAATYLTLALYMLIYFGMMAQIILGPLQLMLAIIISVNYYRQLDHHHQILIIYYWFASVSALIVAMLIWFGEFNQAISIIGLFPIPMCVACYFLYVTRTLDSYLNKPYEP